MEGVIAYDMPFLYHPLYKLRTGFQIVSHQKKSCRRLVLFQRVENFRRVAVLIPRVKGQIQHLVVGVLDIVGAELFQIIRSRVGNGRLPRLLEAQPPVAVR